MNKISQALLERIFSKEQTPSLMEVVNATSNPEIAVEILCGLYSEPSLLPVADIKNYGECQFIKYDKWNDKVHFQYLREKTVHIYIDKDLSTSLIDKDNYQNYKRSWKEGEVKSCTIPLGEKEICKDDISRETWEKYHYVPDSMVP